MVATKKYTYGLGRRKAATASARLYKGKGEITINDKPALEYLSGNKTYLAEITDPLALAEKQKDYDITIVVKGGGLAGQVDAIKLATLLESRYKPVEIEGEDHCDYTSIRGTEFDI